MNELQTTVGDPKQHRSRSKLQPRGRDNFFHYTGIFIKHFVLKHQCHLWDRLLIISSKSERMSFWLPTPRKYKFSIITPTTLLLIAHCPLLTIHKSLSAMLLVNTLTTIYPYLITLNREQCHALGA